MGLLPLVFETSAIPLGEPSWCSREESNLYHKLRKLASYPLNDGSMVLGARVELARLLGTPF